jgi:hypothetical protein
MRQNNKRLKSTDELSELHSMSIKFRDSVLRKTHLECFSPELPNIYLKKIKKLHGLSPRANYTDRATAASRRSNCQLLRIKGAHVVSVTGPYGCILGFLYRSRYFSIK